MKTRLIYKLKGQAAFSTECSNFAEIAETFRQYKNKKTSLDDLEYFIRIP